MNVLYKSFSHLTQILLVCNCDTSRSQGDLYRTQGKFESGQADQERITLELDKEKLISSKQKEDNKRLMEELTGLQDVYDKTSIELTKTKDMEVKLKEDLERTTYDLEMCRERLNSICQVHLHNVELAPSRFDKCQTELRGMRQEKEKVATDCDRLSLDLERAATQHNKAQTGLDRSQEEVARLQVRLSR